MDALPADIGGLAASPDVVLPGKYIKHVVIIVQENRDFDNIFHQFESKQDGEYGYTHSGQRRRCTPD